jgi:ATP-dependent DNA helicase RecQ
LARFLCGIASPAVTRAKLGRHPDFGALGEIPFRKILEMVAM